MNTPNPDDRVSFDDAEQAGVDATLRDDSSPERLSQQRYTSVVEFRLKITMPNDSIAAAFEANLLSALRYASTNPRCVIDFDVQRTTSVSYDTTPF